MSTERDNHEKIWIELIKKGFLNISDLNFSSKWPFSPNAENGNYFQTTRTFKRIKVQF